MVRISCTGGLDGGRRRPSWELGAAGHEVLGSMPSARLFLGVRAVVCINTGSRFSVAGFAGAGLLARWRRPPSA
jgi:hypothetical protein